MRRSLHYFKVIRGDTMKKLLSGAVSVVLAGCLFVSCATTGTAAESAAEPEVTAAAAAVYVLNASELDLNADIAGGTKAGTDGFFTLNVPNPAESKLVVDANNKTVEGTAYSRRLKLGGMLNTVTFTVPLTASVAVVCCSSSNSAVRSLEFKTGDGTAVAEVPAPGSPVRSTVELAPGTYSLQAAGGGGVNVYEVEVTLQ